MKKLILKLTFLLFICSCAYEKEGEIVMDKDGNYFKLTTFGALTPSNAYRLEPVDTTKYKVKEFKKR